MDSTRCRSTRPVNRIIDSGMATSTASAPAPAAATETVAVRRPIESLSRPKAGPK
jgi:hypothetical protein